MKELSIKELNSIVGGSISGAILSSIIKGATFIFELGRSFGSALRRLITNNLC